jgi:carbonic anhydrase
MIQHNDYYDLLKNNILWTADKLKTDSGYFKKLSLAQKPNFLFIGCSDSRIPLDVITGSEPGELFVHRNIANQINLTDMNLLAILEYAVEILNIEHIIVLGHYNCGGVKAAVTGLNEEDIVQNWVSHISDLYHLHRKELDAIEDKALMYNQLSEMNVILQIKNLLRTPIMQRAFRKKKRLCVHGWMFDINTGLINDMTLPLDEWKEFDLLPEDYF